MEAKNILKSFKLVAEQSKDFERVMKQLDDHFIPRKKQIHERAKFNQRKQNVGKSAEQFIRSLYKISENCDFGTEKKKATSGVQLSSDFSTKNFPKRGSLKMT